MVYRKLTPNLVVDDVKKTVEFYKDILKFSCAMDVKEKGEKIWALMKRDKIEIMIQSRESMAREIPLMTHKEAGGSLSFYIEIDKVEDLFEELFDKDVIIEELHLKPYGMREFSIQDCNGFVLTFAEKV